MAKPYPAPFNEASGLEALCSWRVLDGADDSRFDRLCGLAARRFGVAAAGIALLDRERSGSGRRGLDARKLPRAPAFCNRTILGDQVFLAPDVRLNARLRENPCGTGEPAVRVCDGAPLVTGSVSGSALSV